MPAVQNAKFKRMLKRQNAVLNAIDRFQARDRVSRDQVHERVVVDAKIHAR